jgi:hypothetical protein
VGRQHEVYVIGWHRIWLDMKSLIHNFRAGPVLRKPLQGSALRRCLLLFLDPQNHS